MLSMLIASLAGNIKTPERRPATCVAEHNNGVQDESAFGSLLCRLCICCRDTGSGSRIQRLVRLGRHSQMYLGTSKHCRESEVHAAGRSEKDRQARILAEGSRRRL